MIKYKNLIVVGTSHIAKQSLEEVELIITTEKPAVVALELDRARLAGLMNKELKRKPSIFDVKKIGFKGYLFAKAGEFAERKMGAQVGVSPGDEMLKAAEIASKVGAKVALVDQDIKVTMKNFSKAVTWREKFRFIGDVFKQIFKRKKNRKLPFKLNKVPGPEIVEKLMNKMQERYPTVYMALVGDRNVYMAKRLHKLMGNYDKIVAVVGAGHSKGLVEEVKKLEKGKIE
jgi:pheromone shutdown-related protein TraB